MAIMESRKTHRRDKIANVEFEERVLNVARVSKVVKGGRKFSFSSYVVIGDKSGHVGFGHGKSLDVNGSKRKAVNSAKNNLFQICVTKLGTIPHEVTAKSGATTVLIRPAKPGTGVIAGGAIRPIAECVGLIDVVAKIYGSRNQANVTLATISALMKLKSVRYFRSIHGPDSVGSSASRSVSSSVEGSDLVE